jgi:tetratricopeptide (TPR) repeat protein
LIEVDQPEATNVLFAVNELRIADSVTDDLVELATVGKTFSDSYLIDLIIAFCQADNTLQRNLAKEKADLVQQHWEELNTALKESLAQVYLMLKDWSVAKSLWYKLVDNSEHESQALRLYLISWYHQKQQVRELIVELARWRLNFTPDQTLLQLELNLYQQLNNYAGVAEVTAIAIYQFPDVVNFWAMRIFALYRLGHMDQLMSLLDNRLLTISLSPFDKWQLARIYLLCGQNETGKEAFYQVLKQNSLNPVIKTAYLDLTNQFEEAYNTPSPEIVEEGMVVRYSTATDRKVLEITPQSAKDLPLAKAMLGKGIN